MAEDIVKIKVSQLPYVGNINDFDVFGVDKGNGGSAKASMSQLRGLDGVHGKDAKNIELRRTSSHIQWRLEGGAWSNLVPLDDLVGPEGARGPAFRYEDFTPEQITALKQPAIDAAQVATQAAGNANAAADRVDQAIEDAEEATAAANAATKNWIKRW